MKVVKIVSVLMSGLLLLTGSVAADSDVFTVTDKKGRAMAITLVSKKGEKFVIRRVKDNVEFTITASSLDEASQKVLLKEAADLPVSYPKLDLDVTIGKRRKPDNGSYYMRVMEVSSKVTLTNMERDNPSPPCDCALVLFGQDQRNEEVFQVLSNQKFKLTPSGEGAVFNIKPFNTRYDSDNKGYGNIGGFKYVGYLLIVRDLEKNVIATKTVYSKIKKALSNPAFAKTMYDAAAGTQTGENMKPL